MPREKKESTKYLRVGYNILPRDLLALGEIAEWEGESRSACLRRLIRQEIRRIRRKRKRGSKAHISPASSF